MGICRPFLPSVKKSPPEPVTKKRKVDTEEIGSPEAQLVKIFAVGITVDAKNIPFPFKPIPLKTSMPHFFSPVQDPSSPTLLGFYTFTDEQK